MSVIDGAGNVASMTVSNGEGCGRILPRTGIMLNNMLGEQDLNPHGFHRWRADERMTSMMAPSLVLFRDGRRVATGSGGSNRIRTAVLQVLVNLIDFGMSPEAAVRQPRLHVEDGLLSIEGGLDAGVVDGLCQRWPRHERWDTLNLFFGGAHTVVEGPHGLAGVGDSRRGGVCRIVA
jgi:gamma-glutamyltranspeptidase/glutathione hydrolase